MPKINQSKKDATVSLVIFSDICVNWFHPKVSSYCNANGYSIHSLQNVGVFIKKPCLAITVQPWIGA